MKVFLVTPPASESQRTSESGWWQPLGLLSIAAYLREKQDVEVHVLDGEIQTESEILSALVSGGDVIGLGPTILSYPSSLVIAQAAKDAGMKVVLGGPHATSCADQIMELRDFVDAVVVGDGEIAFSKFCAGENLSEIPNLVYHDGSSVRHNPALEVDLNSIPAPAMDLVSVSDYMENFRRLRANSAFQRPIVNYSQKGCSWRVKRGACVFCGRQDQGWRGIQPERVVEHMAAIVEQYNADCIVECCDDFAADSRWVTRFFEAKAVSGLDVMLRVYVRSSATNGRSAQMLAEGGVVNVFLGIESGDDELLRAANKGANAAIHRRACQELARVGISIDVGFVIGLPGESRESLERSVEFLAEVSQYGIAAVSFNLLTPLPGSPSHSMLINDPEMLEKYGRVDHFDTAEAQGDWIRRHTKITREDFYRARDRVEAMFPDVSTDYKPVCSTT